MTNYEIPPERKISEKPLRSRPKNRWKRVKDKSRPKEGGITRRHKRQSAIDSEV